MRFRGRCEPFGADSVERTFRSFRRASRSSAPQSDMLEGIARTRSCCPETWVKGTLKCQVQVFPSTLADLQKGLEALLREPDGCFEQTSTSNYPNVLILNYLKESDADPARGRAARPRAARPAATSKLIALRVPSSRQADQARGLRVVRRQPPRRTRP